MRNVTKSSVSALAALFIGSTALASIPALAAPAGVHIAQAEPERKGGERGGAGGSAPGDRGGGPRMERAPRGDVAPRSERAPRGGGERGAQAPNAAPNVAPRPAQAPGVRPERRSMERDRTITRRDAAPDRRYDRRYDRRDDRRYSRDRRYDDRRYRVRPGYRQGFVFLGGPRVIVRGYGPNWCRGLHRGYHWAPRIGWHAATHRGLFRC